MPKKSKIIRFLPSIIWMIVIFHFSGLQTTGITGTFNQRFAILKSFHLIEYAVLCVLLYFGYRKYKYTIFTGYLYALSDEFHQRFTPGRESRLRDTYIDLLGIFIGIAIIKVIKKINVPPFLKGGNKGRF